MEDASGTLACLNGLNSSLICTGVILITVLPKNGWFGTSLLLFFDSDLDSAAVAPLTGEDPFAFPFAFPLLLPLPAPTTGLNAGAFTFGLNVLALTFNLNDADVALVGLDGVVSTCCPFTPTFPFAPAWPLFPALNSPPAETDPEPPAPGGRLSRARGAGHRHRHRWIAFVASLPSERRDFLYEYAWTRRTGSRRGSHGRR